MQQHPTSGHTSSSMTNEAMTAVPTLKVMRLQKPELDIAKAGTLVSSGCLLGSSLCLPDSFGVIHVGETFTAYLGALNVSKRLPVINLTVTAQLQTPSQRWHMASKTLDECNAAGGCELQPEEGIDSIVSHTLEEAGQHILRVEVGYGGTGGTMKSLRKFYRFQVSNPLVISDHAYRTGDSSCFLSISLQNNGHESRGGLTMSSADFEAVPGLITESISCRSSNSRVRKRQDTNPASESDADSESFPRGVDLLDHSGRLGRGDCKQYVFKVSALGSQVTSGSFGKGVTAGDQIGKAIFTWRKACGEIGRMASIPVICPSLHTFLDVDDPGGTAKKKGVGTGFAMHTQGSSLSSDITAQASARAEKSTHASVQRSLNAITGEHQNALDLIFPITVQPINPPKQLQVGIPFDIEFLVVNHSDQFMSAQLQFRSDLMKGILVCGPSSKNLEEIPGNGGKATVLVRFIALSAGLAQLTGCFVVNLATGQSVAQPPMLNTMVLAN
mmetsp:Transcript_3467/g.8249  ORF Transcript_3467/g.8249 Transcript_3467/m.8249 type:complete len:500 (-) Transcript_3467:224-1723(-)|eukprot:CAMPEP_0116097228 /NCGR_PEP_ID=MMETSP0327-20121206/10600_1 /TAXON_ID=44447 /ORGANISM="Pseudo-nitzschia delicatissima, Strain B596" /LENGTH=499 /DNA_ID=CAMNT_0003588979 /DNA_START=152 /DNA_END=1654 /DNA_ORIENTATION=+